MDSCALFHNGEEPMRIGGRRTRPVFSLALSPFLIFVFIQTCHSARNITVDDRDPSIEYVDDERVRWERMEWRMSSAPRANSLTWMSTWQDIFDLDETATSTSYVASYQIRFNFSGTALYLSYPLWPTQASTGMISVDGSPPVIIDLRDTTQSPVVERVKNLPPSSPSKVRYALEDLAPGTHSVVISAVPGFRNENFWVVFDQLTYTDDSLDVEPGFTITSTPNPTYPLPEQTPSPPEPTLSPPSAQPQNSRSMIIIATCASVIFAALLALVLFVVCRKRRRQGRERPLHDANGVESGPQTYLYHAQVTLASASGHDPGYHDAELEACPSTLPSLALPPSNTYHHRSNTEALLQRDATSEGRVTLHERNRLSTMAATNESATAPPPYESLLHPTPVASPDPGKSPVVLQYPGSNSTTVTTSTAASRSVAERDGGLRRTKDAL